MPDSRVLVLNRSSMPIHVTTARRAFSLIHSRVHAFARDKFTCQCCGARPPRSDLDLDHAVPRSLGGRTSWENAVCSCVDCNRRKGGRTPQQARFRLRRKPTRPRWTPMVHLGVSSHRYEEWRPFLSIVDGSFRTAPAVD